jgi:anti-sigma B factor antagonist
MDPVMISPVSVTTGSDGALEVTLRGEIDYTNAAAVVEAVRAAVLRERPSAILVDMAEVVFLDSSGIAVLVKAMKAAREAAADFRVRAPRPKVLDQLRMTGLTELFPVEEARPADGGIDGEAGGG